jgi:hypothetical protein
MHSKSAPQDRVAYGGLGESIGSLAGGILGGLAVGLLSLPAGPGAIAAGVAGSTAGSIVGGQIGSATGALVADIKNYDVGKAFSNLGRDINNNFNGFIDFVRGAGALYMEASRLTFNWIKSIGQGLLDLTGFNTPAQAADLPKQLSTNQTDSTLVAYNQPVTVALPTQPTTITVSNNPKLTTSNSLLLITSPLLNQTEKSRNGKSSCPTIRRFSPLESH